MACAGLLALAVAFWTATLLAGIALANRVLRRPPDGPQGEYWDGSPIPNGRAIRTPNVLHAAAIVAATGVVNFFILLGAIAVAESWGATRPVLLVSPLLYLFASAMLAGWLPTTFSRAAVAVFFQYLVAGLLLGGFWVVTT
ncbi:MAG: hypothetical protein K2X82_31240 [Gemmataceae bacterium]|nr:hypothetical protein [Gemmataceae bacterium]